MNLPCRCNRNFSHCLSCGSRNIYVLMNETELRSAKYNERVQCYRCKRCMAIFDDKDVCQAPKKFTAGSFSTSESPVIPGETSKQKISRLLNEGKTPQQVKEIMAEEGVDVLVKDESVQESNPVVVEPGSQSQPISMDDVVSQIERNNK